MNLEHLKWLLKNDPLFERFLTTTYTSLQRLGTYFLKAV